jgi:hypothetical protein
MRARVKNTDSESDLLGDPFNERSPIFRRGPLRLLGSRFVFESNSEPLLRLVDAAYAGLPPHRMPAATGELRVRLCLMSRGRSHRRAEPAPLEMFSGAGFVGGATDPSNFVVLSERQRSALVAVQPRMLDFPYHTRYELIEFAVYALAARVQGLVSLHAACVGSKGRGVLLMGASGAGKSTLALQCLLQGLDFLSEDSVLVAPGTLQATGIANFLHVGADSLRWLPRGPLAEQIRNSPLIRRRSGARKFEADLRASGHRLATSALKTGAIVFLTKESADGKPLLTALSQRDAGARLRESQVYAVGQPGWSAFMRGVSALPAFEMGRGRHPQDAVEALWKLL